MGASAWTATLLEPVSRSGTFVQLVLASHNLKKLAELEAAFDGLGLDMVAAGALGADEPDEPHGTFLENALTKARQAARHTGRASLADDSGLCVEALGGAPGVISAQYASASVPEADRESRRRVQDEANNRLLLERLGAAEDRRARFVSTLVAVRSADDPEPLVAVGRWPGEILRRPLGTAGFGYDPLMFIPALGATVAMLDPATKNRHSHRALAAQQMRVLMREVWGLG